ncbi:MAG: hypothetical protein CML47_07015 [Rhodobacteraceae bacterium]|jgi:hypothetical protein|nr:MAG: hypothetical protein CML47_07015 [Paracoccaceae bacterium]|tara:strand:+ start:7506 stop:7790 length:285 start_codon:yes stop_codon:yes gene_type:complete
MENCSKIVKIVFGYILGITLLTVLILSLNIHFHKNIREGFMNKPAKARNKFFMKAIPITIVAILLLPLLLEGLFFLISKLPFGCTDCYQDWRKG